MVFLEKTELKSAIEAILFASGDPVPAERLARVLDVSEEEVFESAKELSDTYSFERRGIRLVRLEGSLQLCSSADWATQIAQVLEQRRPPRLTQAGLEVVSIVAYYQPVTRAYVEQVRGVDSSYTIGMLTERGLIEPCGRLEVPGRPTLFRTTELFLRTLGISSLEELPELPDMTTDEGLEQLQSAIEALKAAPEGQLVMLENGSIAETPAEG